MTELDVIVVGAGGAGMMCGIQSAARGRSTLILDHSSKLGRKILISGGGRCNFTNTNAAHDNYVSSNPHFHKSALSRYTASDFITLVEKHEISYHEKKLGQLFCDNSAQSIVDMLESECQQAGARLMLNCHVKEIVVTVDGESLKPFQPHTNPLAGSGGEDEEFGETDDTVSNGDGFVVRTTRGTFRSQSLVVATGGLSVPKTGATSFGYDLARHFGLSIVDTAPALDGFVFASADRDRYGELYGTAADTIVTCGPASFRENVLFTHRGLSGPAGLQASLYWHDGEEVKINFSPDNSIDEQLKKLRLESNRQQVQNVVARWMPKRLATRLCALAGVSGSLSEVSNEKISRLADMVENHAVVPEATVGYIKAEVTRGGVDTNELSSRTMESRKVKGLFFIGEVVDVTGQLGGFNFQWAWSSGYAAGQAV